MIKENLFVEILKPLTRGTPFAINLEDDVCFLQTSLPLIISTDSVVEGWHCLEDTDPYKIGWKLLARNLSDLAAKGATPLAFTLNLFLNEKHDANYIKKFKNGIEDLVNALNLQEFYLIGGDISRSLSDNITASMTIFGTKDGYIPCRSKATEGAKIFCTGEIGLAYLGFCLKTNNKFASFIQANTSPQQQEIFINKYEKPLPLIQKGIELSKYACCMMDISDGIIKDFEKIKLASNLSKTINQDLIPVPDFVNKNTELRANCIDFGDDYELLVLIENPKPNTKLHKISN